MTSGGYTVPAPPSRPPGVTQEMYYAAYFYLVPLREGEAEKDRKIICVVPCQGTGHCATKLTVRRETRARTCSPTSSGCTRGLSRATTAWGGLCTH